MNATETIQAAIEKLEYLKDNSTPGPWLEEDHQEEFVGFIVGHGYKLATEISIIEDGELIVALHRTIDAQLAILRDGLEVAESIASLGFGSTLGRNAHAFALAKAILEVS